MDSETGETPLISGTISSSIFPEHERLNSWRERFGEQFLRLHIDPLDDQPFRYDASFLMVPGLNISKGCVSALKCTRTSDLIDDQNDDFVVLIPRRGTMQVIERGRETTIGPGEALVRRSSEVGQTLSTSGEYLTMSAPYALVASQVLDIDHLGFATIQGANPILRLLDSYLSAMLDNAFDASLPPQNGKTAKMAARHVQELLGLVLDSSRDNWQRLDAGGSGVHAARLAAIRADIARYAIEPEFSINDVARRQGVSPGYIRKLLATQDTRFSDMLRTARLDLAHQLLKDPLHRHARITEIAYHCGFSDISYFNRCFRQRYGMTPGEARRMDSGNT